MAALQHLLLNIFEEWSLAWQLLVESCYDMAAKQENIVLDGVLAHHLKNIL